MIIKGKSRSNPTQLASYLLKQGDNERVQFMAAHNVVGNDNLKGALLEMQELAAYANCKNYLYHASINPKEGERLNPQQWAKSIHDLEKNLNLEGHQRAIVKHVKDGREHVHVVWSRIDPQTLKAKRMSWNYVQHEKTARALEREFGLDRVQGAHVEKDGPRHDRGPKQQDADKTRRQSIPAHKVKAEVSRLWEQSDSGKAFTAALHDAGYILARGDKKPFVIIDKKGGVHGLVRRIDEKTAPAMEKMADVDPANLPTVTRAKEMQEEREKIYQSHKTGQDYERQDMASQQAAAMADIEKHFKEQQEQQGKKQEIPAYLKAMQAREELRERQEKEAAQGDSLGKEKKEASQDRAEEIPAYLRAAMAREELRQRKEQEAVQQKENTGNRKKENKDPRAEREAEALKQQKREREEKEARDQYQKMKGGGSKATRPKSAADAARDERDAAREMTDSARRKKQEDSMKEFFEKKFSGSPERANAAYERERTRER